MNLDLKIDFWSELAFFLMQKYDKEELLAVVNACTSKVSEDECLAL